MSGVIPGGLFGSPSKASSKPVDMSAPEFAALRNPFSGVLASLLAGGSQGFNPVGQVNYPSVPLGQPATDALAYAQGAAMDPIRQNLIASTLQGNFLPGQPGANPFLSTAIRIAQQPTAEALQYAVGRQIPGMFAAAGHQVGQTVGSGSTAKDLQVIRAAETGGRALGDIATNMSNQAYQFERGQQNAAMGFDLQNAQNAIANFNAQMAPIAFMQGNIDKGIVSAQQLQQQWLQALGLLGGITQPVIANQGQSTGASKGLFEQLFPKGLQAG